MAARTVGIPKKLTALIPASAAGLRRSLGFFKRRAVIALAGNMLRLIRTYWMLIVVLSVGLLVAVNGFSSLSIAAWLAALAITSVALGVACCRLYSDAKINGHLVRARLGMRPRQASRHYVRALFDGYAENFDKHLLVELSYQAPNHIFSIVRDHFDNPSPVIADLGCGTGICGPLFNRHAGELFGVDLAREMLEGAKNKQCYDELFAGDIVEFLNNRTDAIDIAIAADVLVYYGELEAVFSSVAAALRENGLFAFTVEAQKGEGWRLHSTGRYTHSKRYVFNLAQQCGFSVVEVRRKTLRMQGGKPVWGDVWLLKKPCAGIALEETPTPPVNSAGIVRAEAPAALSAG